MNITMQFVFIEATNPIPDERFRKKRGHVVALYESDRICVPDANNPDFSVLREPVSLTSRLAFIHVKNYPIDSIEPLKEFLTETVDDAGEPVRNRKWLIDVNLMQPETVAILNSKRQITVDWLDQNAALLRRLNVPDITDSSKDELGQSATMAELPTNG